ncbi:tautomerase family protein [Pantoea piersonii]|jgi:phenylpyruvate tautomerase PptA (4-oxalocrotonate tautomerase family)|uniref:Tautomerase family protein n=1 Tax=Pantoea piersonii TaxID=2364647 RepID=A0AAJ5QNM1_9GAMM|nr:tautomerase family protein [Pantoea piersonii]MBZ6388468.1 tautomerase family protein [Pantoea piersonii]MBZ6398170.1 tautomerase family protein [Pantoea piersonii]MBZ6409330.1 tautomerase family protein [Pantoea piersonii]MBZ6426285.1 tautomerase family protein [Pantoea piersonii]NYB01803.1 tautomerase family protein [Pantoea piersonii]
MPLTRITLHKDVSASRIALISDILHNTLVEAFDVPAQDRFQIVEKLPAAQRIYDRHYLSGTRSDDFILFTLLAGRPRSAAQKSAFCRTLAQRLTQQLQIDPDDIMVIIQFNTASDWSFSNGRMLSQEAL